MESGINTLVISDLHIGSLDSLVNVLYKVFSRYSPQRVVIVGDLFDHLDLESLCDNSAVAAFISFIQALARRGVSVVMVPGNHDDDTELLRQLLGPSVEVRQSDYEFTVADRAFWAIHGHQYDPNLGSDTMMNWFTEQVERCARIIDRRWFPKHRRIIMLAKGTRIWRSLACAFARRVIDAAKKRGDIHVVFSGHIHCSAFSFEDGILYVNTCWFDRDLAIAVVDHQGKVRLDRFSAAGKLVETCV